MTRRTLLPAVVITACLAIFATLVLAQPTTAPAEPRDPADPTMPDNMVIRLPDGREVNLQDLQRDGGSVGMVMVRSDGVGTNIQATDERGRKIKITDGPDGITVIIKDGDAEPVEYHAATEDELRDNHPEAYEVYEKHAHKEMMAGLRDGGGMGGNWNAAGQHIMVRTREMFLLEVESLGIGCRPMIEPFARAQLGEGVIVARVDEGSRGETIGLAENDLIKSVNGKSVETIEDLIAAIDGASGQLTIDIMREAKAVKLEEK